MPFARQHQLHSSEDHFTGKTSKGSESPSKSSGLVPSTIITMGGIYFLIENPLTSRLWLESSVQELMKLPGVYEVTCHAGAYGAVNSRGEMIRKGHRWLTNSEWLANQLQTKLTPEQQKQCVPLQGKETTLSQVYCPGSVKAILLGVRQTIQYHQPDRFNRRAYHT